MMTEPALDGDYLDDLLNGRRNGDASTWPELIPLGQDRDLPPFPVTALPAWMAAAAVTVAEELQVPVDLPASLCLVALSLIAAGRVDIAVRGTWREQLNLFLVVAMPPGAGKSPAVKAILGVLEEWIAAEFERLAPIIARAEQKQRMAEAAMRKAETKGDHDEALRYLDELEAIRVPPAPRLWSDDATPEKLVELMSEHDGRMGVVSTEGGVFALMGGRYSDNTSNLDPYLKAWSGDSILVDRMSRASLNVRRPALTIGLTVQPIVLQQVGSNEENRGKGLTARFMYSLPPSTVGHRNLIDAPTADPQVLDAYSDKLLALTARLAAIDGRPSLEICDEARGRYMHWRQSLELRRREGSDLEYLAEWTTKLESATARLSGLLHLADGNTVADCVEDATMRRALAVADYWIGHAKAVHDLWGADPDMLLARRVIAWVRRQKLERFTVRECYRDLHVNAADVYAPLRLLEERGWVRAESELRAAKVGEPSATVTVNPATLSRAVTRHDSRQPVTLSPLSPLSPKDEIEQSSSSSFRDLTDETAVTAVTACDSGERASNLTQSDEEPW